MTQATQPDERRSRWIPWCFVGFFAVVMAANGAMVYFALESWPGLTSDDPYDRGLTYNRTLAAAEAQAALGWNVAIGAATLGAGRARVQVTVADRDGHAIKARLVRAQLVRPTQPGHDSEAVLDDLGGGHYSGEIAADLPGLWDLRVLIEHADGVYRAERRVMLAGDE